MTRSDLWTAPPEMAPGLVVPVDDCDLDFAGPINSNALDSSDGPQPGDLLWRYIGDGRISFTGLSAGILQLMHPEIGAGVEKHSDVFEDPWHRILRSLPEIIGAVHDSDANATGHKVRDFHKSIRGIDGQGRRYNALQPETFWWAHSAFHYMVEEAIDHYTAYDLTVGDRERLYEQSVKWYNNYGLKIAAVPKNYGAFREQWDDTCGEVLEMTPAADHFIQMTLRGEVERHPYIAPEVWEKTKWPIMKITKLVAIGHLPESVRKKFELPWSKRDAAELSVLETSIRATWHHLPLPRWFRYHTRSQEGTFHRQEQSGVAGITRERSYDGLIPYLKAIRDFPQPEYP